MPVVVVVLPTFGGLAVPDCDAEGALTALPKFSSPKPKSPPDEESTLADVRPASSVAAHPVPFGTSCGSGGTDEFSGGRPMGFEGLDGDLADLDLLVSGVPEGDFEPACVTFPPDFVTPEGDFPEPAP